MNYDYPLEGVTSDITFHDKTQSPNKATEKNTSLAREISEKKLAKVARNTSHDVSVIDNPEITITPEDSNLPHKIVSSANDDLNPSIIGAVEGAILSAM